MVPEVSNLKMNLDRGNTTVICPRNDGESAIICDIAQKHSFDVRISSQKWGATLEKEFADSPDTFKNLKHNVVIVEIPGPKREEELRYDHSLFIIDHHSYPSLNRSHLYSSLEQFASLAACKLSRFEMGIAINDRSFIDGLAERGYSGKEIEDIRKYDLERQEYKEEDFGLLEKTYAEGKMEGPFYVIRTGHGKTSYLSDIHIRKHPRRESRPGLVVVSFDEQGHSLKISFSGEPAIAKFLYRNLEGYAGGDEAYSMYWGKTFAQPVGEDEFLASLISSLTNLKKE